MTDTPLWLERLADTAEALVKASNACEWPSTESQIRRVYGAHGLTYEILDDMPITGAFVGRTVAVHSTPCQARLFGRLVHELVECSIRSGALPDLRLPADDTTPHRIACIVEARFLRFFRGVIALRESEEEARERHQAERTRDLPELVRALDEWAESGPVRRGRR